MLFLCKDVISAIDVRLFILDNCVPITYESNIDIHYIKYALIDILNIVVDYTITNPYSYDINMEHIFDIYLTGKYIECENIYNTILNLRDELIKEMK